MPLNRGSLRDRVYHGVHDRIINNEYADAGFLTEASLARDFGVSRAPVREALVQLCNEGILLNMPRAGYQIVQISGKEIADAVRTRVILEAAAARGALQHLDREAIRRMERFIEASAMLERRGTASPDEWWAISAGFHMVIAEAAGNALLVAMIGQTIAILRRAVAQFFRGHQPSEYLAFHTDGHTAILRAVRDRDEGCLVAAVEEDILTLGRIFSVS